MAAAGRLSFCVCGGERADRAQTATIAQIGQEKKDRRTAPSWRDMSGVSPIMPQTPPLRVQVLQTLLGHPFGFL